LVNLISASQKKAAEAALKVGSGIIPDPGAPAQADETCKLWAGPPCRERQGHRRNRLSSLQTDGLYPNPECALQAEFWNHPNRWNWSGFRRFESFMWPGSQFWPDNR